MEQSLEQVYGFANLSEVPMFDWLFGERKQKKPSKQESPRQVRNNTTLRRASPVDDDDDILPYVAMISDGGDCGGSDGGCDGGD